jgi:RNA polymerase sigma factor (sigma-70 family)
VSEWAEILRGLAEGQVSALDRVTCLITNYLARQGAYDYRDSWDDLVQEVLISLLRSPPRSQESAAIVRHIQTTAYRKLVDQIRKVRGRKRTDPGDESQESGWRRQVSLDEAEHASESGSASFEGIDAGLRNALDELGEEERQAVECKYLLGCSNEEGAARLSVSLATYKRRLSKAMGELRGRLAHPSGET